MEYNSYKALIERLEKLDKKIDDLQSEILKANVRINKIFRKMQMTNVKARRKS